MVVANAVAAITEINEASSIGKPPIEMNTTTINKLLTALNECTEWGQIFILDDLSSFNTTDDRKNSVRNSEILPNSSNISKKLSTPFVTLLYSEPDAEVQYETLMLNWLVENAGFIALYEPGFTRSPIETRISGTSSAWTLPLIMRRLTRSDCRGTDS